MTRVAVLWSNISGYLSASLRALAEDDCDIFLSAYDADENAPFTHQLFSWLPPDNIRWWADARVDEIELAKKLSVYRPQLILCSGWSVPQYMSICRRYEGKAVRVLCFDTPWLGTPRQWIGRLWARLRLVPHFERIFVPGQRQFDTAMRLGFKPARIITGLLAPDTEAFSRPQGSEYKNMRTFLYVGRLSPDKGIVELAKAYAAYRKLLTSPWPLVVAGVGPLSTLLKGNEGVSLLGFLQPSELPSLMFESGCLVVPSIYEPWGVQISEAVTAGLPVIATQSCGACAHLVRSGANGMLVESGDVRALAQAMVAISNEEKLGEFSRNSIQLSRQFTPAVFASNLLSACRPLLKNSMPKSDVG